MRIVRNSLLELAESGMCARHVQSSLRVVLATKRVLLLLVAKAGRLLGVVRGLHWRSV